MFAKLFSRNGNRIIVHKKDGRVCERLFISGLNIKFRGKNSIVELWEPYNFVKKFGAKKSKIYIDGDNNYIALKSTNHSIYSLRLLGVKNNNRVIIDENFYSTGSLKIEFANVSNMNLTIGKECMFGQDVVLMLSDYHIIKDITTGKQINKPQSGITIGNKVWLARGVKILEDVSIADNTVVATGSIVTKSFTENNVLLAGIPAKIVKNNITWER